MNIIPRTRWAVQRPWAAVTKQETVAKSHRSGVRFSRHPCLVGDLHRFDLELGSSKGQQVWETLWFLIGLKCRGKFVQNDNVSLRVRSDSVAALTVICKLGSSSPKLNAIAAEISLELSKLGIQEVLAVHLPGEQNTVADKLARLAQPGCDGKLPESLRDAKRRLVQHRDDSFFQMWAVATK
jgi:hypothetical protein